MYVKLDAKLDAFQAKVDARLTDIDRRLARIEGGAPGASARHLRRLLADLPPYEVRGES